MQLDRRRQFVKRRKKTRGHGQQGGDCIGRGMGGGGTEYMGDKR